MKKLLKFLRFAMLTVFVGRIATAAYGAELSSHRSLEFDADWLFHLGDLPAATNVNFDDSDWRRLDLPHDFSVEGNFSPTNASCTGYLPGGVGWYRKHFSVPETARGQRVFVEFDGVQRDSTVWLNGVLLGHRPNGYISFQYDLTPQLRFGSETNILVVRCERENVADSRWYPGTGIYRNVRLTTVNPIYIPNGGVFVTTPQITEKSADVVVSTEVHNALTASNSVQVIVQIIAPDGTALPETRQKHLIAAGETYTFALWQQVPQPHRWSLETPELYTAVNQVFVDGKKTDEVRTSFGIREFHFDAAQGFFLNGVNGKLKGVCMHHDAGALGAAVPTGVLERRLRLVKMMGANAIRCSHNPMAPELYEICDRIGLLVMDEAFDEWEIGKRKWVAGRNVGHADRFGYSADFAQWATTDCTDMVRRDRNHPSIILWSLGNEIDYPTDPYVLPVSRAVEGFAQNENSPRLTRLAVVAPKLIAAVKRVDPTRPVTMALANLPASDAIGLAQMLDVVGGNYQEDLYAQMHREFPERKIFGSENGKGIETWNAVTRNNYVAGQFLWVGFDFLGEAGRFPNHGSGAGLFDTRGFLKTDGWWQRALWSDQPLVHLVAASAEGNTRRRRNARPQWNWNTNEMISVTAFSNCEKVELQLNGKDVGEETVGENRTAIFQVPFQPGILAATGRRQNQIVARDELRTAGAPTRLEVTLETTTTVVFSKNILHAIITIVDGQGVPVLNADATVTVKVAGGGRLLAVDNGDLNDTTPLRSDTKHSRDGKLLAIIETSNPGKPVQITAEATGLKMGKYIGQ